MQEPEKISVEQNKKNSKVRIAIVQRLANLQLIYT